MHLEISLSEGAVHRTRRLSPGELLEELIKLEGQKPGQVEYWLGAKRSGVFALNNTTRNAWRDD